MSSYLRLISLILPLLLSLHCGTPPPERKTIEKKLPTSPHRVGELSAPKERTEPDKRTKKKDYHLLLMRKRTLTHGIIDSYTTEPTTDSLIIASGNILRRFKLSDRLPYSSERRVQVGNRRITAIAFDDTRIFLGLSDETLLVVNRETCQTLFSVIGFFWRIYSILPVNEETILVGDSASVKSVALNERRVSTSYKSKSYDIYALLPLKNGRFLTATGSGRLELWSYGSKDSPIKSVKKHDGQIISLKTDGEKVFTFCRDGSVGIWNPDILKRNTFLTAHPAPVMDGTLTKDKKIVVVLYEDSYIALFPKDKNITLLCQKLEVTSPLSVVATGNNTFAVLTRDGHAFVYRIITP